MVRQFSLLMSAVLVATGLALSSPAVAEGAPTCTSNEIQFGTCGVSDGSGVVLSGTQTGRQPGSGDGAGDTAHGRSLTPAEILALLNQLCVGNANCGDQRGPQQLNTLLLPSGPGSPATGGVGAQVVTAADVARFLPALGSLHSEPNGWAVVGVPANFWADVRPVSVAGTLLGGPAQVRFTPQVYRWIYGDGSERATATPGATWATLGQQELTATATSHDYAARGSRQARVEVLYSAEYQVGAGPWLPVVGAVTGTTPSASILVVTERTVLTPPA
jgi:hypothetical protein